MTLGSVVSHAVKGALKVFLPLETTLAIFKLLTHALPGLGLLYYVWEESKHRMTHIRYDTNHGIANLG